jgi:aromatic ring-opening dioxygenase catalytic subunit (LigB family)
MGRVVAAMCLSHSPGLTGFPERARPESARRVLDAVSLLARELAEARPDALVVVSAEHYTNFFVSNLPTFALGTAERYEMPASDAFASFLRIPRHRYPGHAELGGALARELVARGFDLSLCAGGYGFDEGFAVPLALLAGSSPVPVVPIVVNAVHPPYPSLSRCLELGAMLAEAVEAQPIAERVALVGSGGLSHWVGTARAGEIDEAFDRRVLEALATGKATALAELDDAELGAAGNGAHELRAWLVVAGAVDPAPFEVLAYEPVPAWLTGTAVARAALGTLGSAREREGSR